MGMTNALNLLCGLALFLYGMHVMGEGLTRASGGRLEGILESLTKSKIKAVLLGAGVTAVIQSSSATTVMVVGFVNSGIMRLSQAAGVIMGANIGTTITSWILSLTGLQGDSLLLARENLFVTFVEVYRERFGKLPHLRQMKVIANIIAWNLWQMDGTKYVVPGSCKENKIEIISWFGSEEQIDLCPGCKSGNIRAHNGIYSIIKDWRSNQTMTFLSMVRGGKASGSV